MPGIFWGEYPLRTECKGYEIGTMSHSDVMTGYWRAVYEIRHIEQDVKMLTDSIGGCSIPVTL